MKMTHPTDFSPLVAGYASPDAQIFEMAVEHGFANSFEVPGYEDGEDF